MSARACARPECRHGIGFHETGYGNGRCTVKSKSGDHCPCASFLIARADTRSNVADDLTAIKESLRDALQAIERVEERLKK